MIEIYTTAITIFKILENSNFRGSSILPEWNPAGRNHSKNHQQWLPGTHQWDWHRILEYLAILSLYWQHWTLPEGLKLDPGGLSHERQPNLFCGSQQMSRFPLETWIFSIWLMYSYFNSSSVSCLSSQQIAFIKAS